VNFLTRLNWWLGLFRPIFETLYFLAAVALAAVAYKGLEQLRIAKDTAKMNARREAFKLAADECRNFAIQVVPLADVLRIRLIRWRCRVSRIPSSKY
jgi:hypothetical protein